MDLICATKWPEFARVYRFLWAGDDLTECLFLFTDCIMQKEDEYSLCYPACQLCIHVIDGSNHGFPSFQTET